jgi:hypothetical protein
MLCTARKRQYDAVIKGDILPKLLLSAGAAITLALLPS